MARCHYHVCMYICICMCVRVFVCVCTYTNRNGWMGEWVLLKKLITVSGRFDTYKGGAKGFDFFMI